MTAARGRSRVAREFGRPLAELRGWIPPTGWSAQARHVHPLARTPYRLVHSQVSSVAASRRLYGIARRTVTYRCDLTVVTVAEPTPRPGRGRTREDGSLRGVADRTFRVGWVSAIPWSPDPGTGRTPERPGWSRLQRRRSLLVKNTNPPNRIPLLHVDRG